MKILEQYMNALSIGIKSPIESDLNKFLFGYDKHTVYSTSTLREQGVLKEERNHDTAYIFEFDNYEKQDFHTHGMKHDLDIHYFDDKGMKVKTDFSCKPDKDYSSDKPSKWVVEVFTK